MQSRHTRHTMRTHLQIKALVMLKHWHKSSYEKASTKLFYDICLALWKRLRELHVTPGNSQNLMVRMDVLPIYAAGDVTREATRSQACTVLDRSISSYIPSFGELKYTRQNAQARRDCQSRSITGSWSSLIASRSITSGQVPLPYVTQEATEGSICITGQSLYKHSSDQKSNSDLSAISINKDSTFHLPWRSQ